MLSRTFLLLLLLSLGARGDSRTIAQFIHRGWTARDGAPPNVMAITQTADGFLWLASSQGLYRFDGVEFERFAPLGQPLPSASVYSLLAGPNGDLWVGSAAAGLSHIHNGTNRNYLAADGFPEGAVLSLAQDRQGTLWAATQQGLARLIGDKWHKVGAESGFEGTPISLHLSPDGTFWAASINAVFALPPGASAFQRRLSSTRYVMHMLESPGGVLWMAETGVAVRPFPAPGKDPRISLGSQRLLFDQEGSLWIPTLGDGLRRVPLPDLLTHEKLGKTSNEIESFTAKDGLSADYVPTIYQDREGNIWVGTSAGLDRFSKGAVVPVPVPGTLTRTTMAPGEGNDVWVGGLSVASGRVHENKWMPEPSRLTAFVIAPDPVGGTWWAADVAGFRELHGRFTRFGYPPAFARNAEAVRMAVDRSGSLWIAGEPGIFVRTNG